MVVIYMLLCQTLDGEKSLVVFEACCAKIETSNASRILCIFAASRYNDGDSCGSPVRPRRIFVIFHWQKGARLQQRQGAFHIRPADACASTRTSAGAFIAL